ncbi:unnamed protein product [Plutella xylostella]|uniref:(diamondback moth) hypothetical protein n=1 Tax=Plutella xylostella TaxID=51655 RepID=A0A8S4D2Y8_PLUXY|nr:unnamed protein product [Plutella xylostella]
MYTAALSPARDPLKKTRSVPSRLFTHSTATVMTTGDTARRDPVRYGTVPRHAGSRSAPLAPFARRPLTRLDTVFCEGVYTPNPPTRRHSPAAWCRRPKPANPPTCVMGLCRRQLLPRIIMTTENGSSMEMGTSDQVLVAAKRKKTITFVIGAAAMLLTVGVVITLVVLLSGNEGGSASPIVTPPDPTTPSTPGTPAPTPETPPATPEPPPETTPGTPEIPESTPDPTPSPPEELEPIQLEDIISGAYTPNGFNGSFTSGNEVLFRSGSGDLQLLDVAAASATTLVQNNSEILQQSSRVASLSADGSHVVLAYNVLPVYRYSFLARYAAVDSTGAVLDVAPPGVREGEGFLQNFVWGPVGTACAFVYLNNVYYKPNITAEPVQLSDTGKLNVLYNGIPDWVYEEEVLSSNNAIWFSPSGSQLAYATFDDGAVRVMRVPHYGVPGAVEYQYTQHREIRYPKVGRRLCFRI